MGIQKRTRNLTTTQLDVVFLLARRTLPALFLCWTSITINMYDDFSYSPAIPQQWVPCAFCHSPRLGIVRYSIAFSNFVPDDSYGCCESGPPPPAHSQGPHCPTPLKWESCSSCSSSCENDRDQHNHRHDHIHDNHDHAHVRPRSRRRRRRSDIDKYD